MTDLPKRKADHLAIAASGEADFRERTTLLEEVELVHEALPELALDEIDLSCEVLGKRLAFPVLIGAMTGGTPEAERVNRDLASAAEAEGVALCLGSQRAMSGDPALARTYRVREAAPGALLFGNLGVVQAKELGARGVEQLMAEVGADALFVHLNPAMELVQPGGDRDFRGAVAFLGELAARLGDRLWVKETGSGLSRRAARQLAGAGVRHVETGGAGGTSWVAVELLRKGERAGEAFREWGVPTAAAVAWCAAAGLDAWAGGGLRGGLDVARAMALGAAGGALAAPLLRAQREGGAEGVRAALRRVRDELRLACALTASRRPRDLARADRILGPNLARWL